MTKDEMVGWHHRLNGHGFGWTLGFGNGQGSLVCCSPWGRKESVMLLLLLSDLATQSWSWRNREACRKQENSQLTGTRLGGSALSGLLTSDSAPTPA